MKRKPTLKDLVEAAHKEGMKITFGMCPKEMPARFPSDPPSVKMLVNESERVTDLGNRWRDADRPNDYAAQEALKQGWAHALSAAWLRCKLKGELLPESDIIERLESRINTALSTLQMISEMPRCCRASSLARSTLTFIKECENERLKQAAKVETLQSSTPGAQACEFPPIQGKTPGPPKAREARMGKEKPSAFKGIRKPILRGAPATTKGQKARKVKRGGVGNRQRSEQKARH